MGACANAPINSKVQHPPWAIPRAFELLKVGFFKFPPIPSKQKSPSNAPPISTELPPLKDNFVCKQTLYTPFRERYSVNDFFKLLLRTLLKSVKPCKNRKNSQAYYVRTKDKFGSNSPPLNPTQRSNFLLPEHDAQSNARGMPGGRDVEVLN